MSGADTDKEELMGMDLHEVAYYDKVAVLRVIGGWVYTVPMHLGQARSSVFVPEVNK